MSTDVLEKQTRLVRRALSGGTMGSRWSVVFFAPERFDVTGLRVALQSVVDRVDQQMSTWKAVSDLNRLNGSPAATWVDLPSEMIMVLDASLEIGRASDGLFDIGVGDLVKAWGFGFDSRHPDFGHIAALGGREPFEAPKKLQIDVIGQRARKLAPVLIDLSAIAKGFGVDELARVMDRFGVNSYLVGIDGEMRACGRKPGGLPWVVGHERPLQGARELAGILELTNVAVATSGNYRYVAAANGRRVSHTMDPRTGEPLSNDLAAVTVLAPTCMVADAWATALLVAGAERGLLIARAQVLRAVLVRNDGGVVSTV